MSEVTGYFEVGKREFLISALYGLYALSILRLVSLIMVGLLAWLFYNPPPSGSTIDLAKNLAFPVIFLVLLPAITLISALRQYKSMPEGRKRGAFVISDSGLQIESGVSKSDIRWEGIHSVRENFLGFQVFFSTAVSQLLPRRAFRTPEEIHAARALFKIHLGERASLKGTA